eukprot:2920445-Pyramimonas_sp.AAC.1
MAVCTAHRTLWREHIGAPLPSASAAPMPSATARWSADEAETRDEAAPDSDPMACNALSSV